MLQKESFHVIQSFTRTSLQDVLRLGGGIHREYLARTDVGAGSQRGAGDDVA